MSESHTDTPDKQQASGGKHRGQAASSEEPASAGQGRHRRPASGNGTNG